MKKIGNIFAIVTAISVTVFLVAPLLFCEKTKAIISSDMESLSKVGQACMMFAQDHNGQYPQDWSYLTNYANIPKLYVSTHDRNRIGAMSNVMNWTSYVYNRGVTRESSPDTVVAYLPPGNYKKWDGGLILFADGSVASQSLEEFNKTIKKPQQCSQPYR